MSMKKSIAMVIAVIAFVTVFQVMTSGENAMLIDMSDTAISFSGIDDFRHEVAYADMASVAMEDVPDWSQWGDQEFGVFRIGHLDGYVLFATTQVDRVIIIDLADGTQMVFNYNNSSDTESIYQMLLNNLQ